MTADAARRRALLRAAADSWGQEAADTLSELLPPPDDRPATGRDIEGVLAAIDALDTRLSSRIDVLKERIDRLEMRFDAFEGTLDLKFESAVDRITAAFERRISDAVTTQTRTLVFSQLGALVVLAALVLGLQ